MQAAPSTIAVTQQDAILGVMQAIDICQKVLHIQAVRCISIQQFVLVFSHGVTKQLLKTEQGEGACAGDFPFHFQLEFLPDINQAGELQTDQFNSGGDANFQHGVGELLC